MEHAVDVVLNFEGEQHTAFRLLRAAKNRFGSTQEVGIFEMTQGGLRPVRNPSELLLAERPLGTPGSVVTASREGTRPLLIEVQALVAPDRVWRNAAPAGGRSRLSPGLHHPRRA